MRDTEPLPEAVQGFIARHRLLRRGERVLVAVSGGIDSLVLLHVLHTLARTHGWRLQVAHFNHGLRGRDSDADEARVRRIASRLALPVVTGRGDVAALRRAGGLSTEMAARQLRHGFLARTARQLRVRTVALAHQADDQVELFFLRLLRGAGVDALAGMPPCSPSPADAHVRLVRPLLERSRRELVAFARLTGLRPRVDRSNQSLDPLRNRLRLRLLPLMRRVAQPALDRVVLRVMDTLGGEGRAVADLAEGWLGGTPGSRPRFSELPVAVQRRVLHRRLLALGILPEYETIERLRVDAGRSVTAPGGLRVRRDARGDLHVASEGTEDLSHRAASMRGALPGRAGEFRFGSLRVRWRLERPRRSRVAWEQKPAGEELVDADSVGGEVTLRYWQPGDRFQPLGMPAPVKLQDLFVNAGVDRRARRERVLAADHQGRIFWVEGIRVGETHKVTASTRRWLRWRWDRVRRGAKLAAKTAGCSPQSEMLR